jgi:alkanesulfonate monooxygenase SsuD/methylene tetrahydromethanopterin reductase-like flavin-dependent oxidoreductase (luciferase family)
MELGAGLGYAPHEFETFGIPLKQRVSRTEECLEILQLAFRGERFSYHGKRYKFDNVKITPGYVQPGGPPLWVASTNVQAMERALRFDTHLLPQGRRGPTLDAWRTRLGELGRDPGRYRVGIIRAFYVTDDRERDWPWLREAERYRMQVYGGFASAAGSGGVEKEPNVERISQRAVAGTVDECVRELVAFIREYGLTDVVTWGSAPGVPPVRMTPMMLKFATEVVPRVRAEIEGAQ